MIKILQSQNSDFPARLASVSGIEEIMMIINHVTEGMISDHVIGGQNVIRFVIRFGLQPLAKPAGCLFTQQKESKDIFF